MYREVFPTRVKQARFSTGFTQDEVARETKIPRSTIAKYETGALEPDLEKLGKLAEFYQKPVGWFIGLQ